MGEPAKTVVRGMAIGGFCAVFCRGRGASADTKDWGVSPVSSSMKNPVRRNTWRRRCVGVLSAMSLGLAWALIPTGPAVSGTVPPFTIDGNVPDAGATQLEDPEGNVKELGPLNSNTTKIGVIHNDVVPTLGLTNPNANVDLRQGWLDTAKDADGDDWLYFAWERDSNNGSGFIAYEFMHNAAPAGCSYDTSTNAQLIANCNPWANRTAGDFIILWDQQGNSTDLYLRTWSGTAPNLTLGAPTLLNANVSAAKYSSDHFRGEAAVNLTDAIFGGATGCITFANTIPSTVTGNSDTADYKDTILKQIPPITNCGSLTVVKITEGGVGTFGFTSNTLDPASFDLTTTAEGAAGSDSTTYSDLLAGTYDVAETVPAGWDLTSAECDDGSPVSAIELAADENITCTFTNTLQQGALKIVKNSTKGGAVLNAGAVFDYEGSSVTDNGAGDEDPAVGAVCVSGLAPGTYTVNETSPPSGYGGAPAGEADQDVLVVAGTDCSTAGAGATATFTNPPLSDIQVNFRDGGSGETSAAITCDDGTGEDASPATGWDTSATHTGIEGATTIVCTIVIDP
jgi:hypothetical protein